MSSPLKKRSYYYDENVYENGHYYYDLPKYNKRLKAVKKVPKKQSKNIFVLLIAMILLGSYAYYVCPYNYKTYFKPLFLNRILNRNINLDVKPFINPSVHYAHNSFILDSYVRSNPNKSSKQIVDVKINRNMTSTKQELLELFKKYPGLTPAVFVWEYSTGSGLEINAHEPYPSASIIKIPILFELMRLIDDSADTPYSVHLSDKMIFSETFRTSGSGNLQKTKANTPYTLNHLASIMIANSDNSATNMILYKIGGKNAFNREMRNLGLKTTHMDNWLPDLEGTNKITAKEISNILYNLDNPNYINPRHKQIIKEYLQSTKNVHLIKEKLPQTALVLHKTGNIGTMLGDSGIIYTDNGRKYIVTILVKRPFNDLRARTLIQETSLIIYNSIKAL